MNVVSVLVDPCCVHLTVKKCLPVEPFDREEEEDSVLSHQMCIRNLIRDELNRDRASTRPIIEPFFQKSKRYVMIDLLFEEQRPKSHWEHDNVMKLENVEYAPVHFGKEDFPTNIVDRTNDALYMMRGFLFKSDEQIIRVNNAQRWMDSNEGAGTLHMNVYGITDDEWELFDELVIDRDFKWVHLREHKKRKKDTGSNSTSSGKDDDTAKTQRTADSKQLRFAKKHHTEN